MQVTYLRLFATCVFSLLGVLLVVALLPLNAHSEEPGGESLVSDWDEADRGPQHQVSARIVARLRDDGRIEFCLRTENEEDVCPRARMLNPDAARPDIWIDSGEVSWEIPVDAELIVDSATVTPLSNTAVESCTPNFERMLAATWKVATTTTRGTAFHIGGGQFLTAHHVIDGVPPFVLLTNGERGMAAAVLDSDPDVDMALLQVYERNSVHDLPVADLRVPTEADLGRPVFLVGYPGAGPLTASLGGIVSRVWEDEILTTSASRGGNSGGPMFDACGEVLGVLWAGSRATNFSHSGSAILRALDGLNPRWPTLPTNVPDSYRLPPGWMIWHFDRTPPDDVDCSWADGDFWIGYAGPETSDWHVVIQIGELTHGQECVGASGGPGVIGFSQPEGAGDNWTPDLCFRVPRTGGDGEGLVTKVLHNSVESFGSVRVTKLGATTSCREEFTHQVEVDFGVPNQFGWDLTMIGEDGTRLHDPEGRGTTNDDRSEKTRPFKAPDGFNPKSIEVRNDHRGIRHLVELVQPVEEAPMLQVSARISVLIESRTNAARLCLLADESQRVCPEQHTLPLDGAVPGKWYRSSTAFWTASIAPELLPVETGLVDVVGYSCALTDEVSSVAWQLSTVSGQGTAVYLGQRQFLAASSLLSEELPWAVVARGEVALPVIQVATDSRNGLSLLELIDGVDASALGTPVPIRSQAALDEDSTKALIGYPSGDANRFTIALNRIRQVSDRSFFFPTRRGWYRDGGPVIDPCTRQVFGISNAGNRVLRSGEVASSIRSMRAARAVPALNSEGPPLFGSAALREQPVYLDTEQPDFGGWICNVRASERYDVMYAVYLAGIESPHRTSIREGAYQYPATCGFAGRIFIVEYRSDEVPDAICVEPRRPRAPLSTLQIEFEAPDGIEMLQATEFRRDPCPGFTDDEGSDYWSSDVYVRLRATTDVQLQDLVLAFLDSEGHELDVILGHDSDVDPDVLSRRVKLPEGTEIAKLVVTVDDSEDGA